MRVAVHYNATAAGAEETVEQIRSAGSEAHAIAADLTRAEAANTLISSVSQKFGSLDVLVNSAAVMVRTPFGEVTPKQWDDIMALNLRAPFFLAQAAAPLLRAARCSRSRHVPRAAPLLRAARGVIVNIADLAAFETWPGYVPHGISKSGVVHLTRSLARVMAPEVRVAGIAPGTVLLPDNWNEASAEHLRATTPLERSGSPADVTSTVLFILDSDYLTGETIIVDGGRHVRR